jgi:hypothetical protein
MRPVNDLQISQPEGSRPSVTRFASAVVVAALVTAAEAKAKDEPRRGSFHVQGELPPIELQRSKEVSHVPASDLKGSSRRKRPEESVPLFKVYLVLPRLGRPCKIQG